MPKASDYLRVKEAAKLLGVVPNTVRAWGQRGKIRELRHPANNYRLYKKSDLEKLLEQIERPATKKK